MERFEISRVKDFKANIIKYIEVQMAHQQQVSLMFSILLTVYILIPLFSLADHQLLGGLCTFCQRNSLTFVSNRQSHFQNV